MHSYSVTSSYLSPRHDIIGHIHELDSSGSVCKQTAIFADQELVIGRDLRRCNYLVWDPVVSNKHLRIHTILYEKDSEADYEALVFAEDISRNGTFLNGSLMGRSKGGFLLSTGDKLRISARFEFYFVANPLHEHPVAFDDLQKDEMEARLDPHFKCQFSVTSRQLGSGAFGSVHMAMDASPTSQMQYACKIIDLRKFKVKRTVTFGRFQRPDKAHYVDSHRQIQKVMDLAARRKEEIRLKNLQKQSQLEVEILKDLNHPNIIGFEKVFVTDNTIYLFQELVTGGDLFSYLESQGKLSEVNAVVIVYQIAVGVNHLHENNIVHRDLKPENILLTSKASGCRIVLTDFGCAKKLDHKMARMSTFTGTEQYAAPEVLQLKADPTSAVMYTLAVDLWSLGCIIATLLIGASPFSEACTHQFSEQLARQCDLNFLKSSASWERLHPRAQDFVQKLLQVDADRRMTAKDAINHEWFTAKTYGAELVEQYHRSIRHWRRRRPRLPVFETFKGGRLIKPTSLIIEESPGRKKKRKAGIPIDPPYRPYPRKMNRPFLPERSTTGPMTPEVREAMKNSWSEEAMARGYRRRQELWRNATSSSSKHRAYSPTAWESDFPGLSEKSNGRLLQGQSPAQCGLLETVSPDDNRPYQRALADKSCSSLDPEGFNTPQAPSTQANSKVSIHTDENLAATSDNREPQDELSVRMSILQERSSNAVTKINPAAHVMKRIQAQSVRSSKLRTKSIYDIE